MHLAMPVRPAIVRGTESLNLRAADYVIGRLKAEGIKQLKDTLVTHKGDHTLNFIVYGMEEEIKVNLSSRKQKVNISSELLLQLEENDVHYKLN